MQKLLDHLSRYTQSYASRESYLRNLEGFCKETSKTPDQLIKLKEEKLSELVQVYAAKMKRIGRSRTHINGVIKRLKTFARCNKLELDVKSYHMPSRYRATAEYIPTKEEIYSMADAARSPRDRAMLLCLWSSGTRVSTLLALNYGDIKEELEADEKILTILIFPEMKERMADACKGGIPYTTFISTEAVLALKIYLRERDERYGPIEDDDPLFATDWNQIARADRAKRRSTRMTVSKMVHRTARRAGIKQWTDIHPHSLRKAFKTVMVTPTLDGGHMDVGTQEFLFGHVLPGSQDPYYDKTKLDYHKAEYSKLNFARETAGPEGADLVLSTLRLALTGTGKDPEKIVNDYVLAKHGSSLPWKLWEMEKQTKLFQEAMEWAQTHETTEEAVTGTEPEATKITKDKVIDVDELEEYLERGWVFVSNVGSDRCVVRQVQS